MSKRKILTLALSICMIAILAVGGSLAYLTDTDNKTNTFTVGNVKIEQNEKDRDGKDFENNQKMFPIVDDSKDENGYHLGKNYIDKIVTVTNTGSEEAYIRTFLAIPTVLDDGPETYNAMLNVMHWNGASAGDDFGLAQSGDVDNAWYWDAAGAKDWPGNAGAWNGYQMTLNGTSYNVYIATHVTKVAAGDTTSPNLFGVYFDATLDFDADKESYFVVRNGQKIYFDMPTDANGDYTWDVLVASQAVQAEGFYATGANSEAYDALEHAFSNPGAADFVCPFGGSVTKVY